MVMENLHFDPSSTAQGGGGSFKNRLVVVNHGWQSESTDGLKGGWSCVCWNGYNGCSGPHPQLLDVVWSSAACSCSCSCSVDGVVV